MPEQVGAGSLRQLPKEGHPDSRMQQGAPDLSAPTFHSSPSAVASAAQQSGLWCASHRTDQGSHSALQPVTAPSDYRNLRRSGMPSRESSKS